MSEKKFKPSVAQLKFMEVWVNWAPAKPITNIGLAMEAGIGESTLYDWYKKPEFMDWFEEERKKLLRSNLATVYHGQFMAARRGDTPAAKLYIERFDPAYKPTRKIEQELTKLPTLKDAKPQRERLGQAIGRFEALRQGSAN